MSRPRPRRRLATLALAALPLGAPACIVRDEFDDSPFDIDPPTQLWYQMHDVVTPADEFHPERSWVDRCLDRGGQPQLDGSFLCAHTDY